MDDEKRVIVALDLNNFEEIIDLLDKIKNSVFGVKIGYEFLFNFGIEGYKKIQKKKINIFFDLKLHDIPNTVQNGIKAINNLQPYFISVHLSGGDNMLNTSINSKKSTKILGITALTSLNNKQIKKYYKRNNVSDLVTDFTYYAMENKLDGIVCSPLEIEIVKKISKDQLIIVTPGIRPSSYINKDDQKRTMTPGKAVSLGADYLVIGRPITKSKNPIKELKDINTEINENKN